MSPAAASMPLNFPLLTRPTVAGSLLLPPQLLPPTPTSTSGECNSNCHWEDIDDQCGPVGSCGYCQVRTRVKKCDGNGDGIYNDCGDECKANSEVPEKSCTDANGNACITSNPTPTPKEDQTGPALPKNVSVSYNASTQSIYSA